MQKITAFVGQVPEKFSQRKLPKIPLIILAILVGAVGTYALIHSFAATPSPSIYWGAWMSGDVYGGGLGDAPWDSTTWNNFEQHAGKKASIVHFGQPAPWLQSFASGPLDLAVARGAIPMMDMDSQSVSLSSIANGSEDSSITTWAKAVKGWGKPFFFRWDWEMNGTWFNWGAQAQQNPSAYVAAWRHIHDLVAAQGASNVTWVWCPNTEFSGSTPISQLYPGDSYVDWTCMDAYNYGTNPLQPDSWKSFSQLATPTYNDLLQVAPTKPIMVGETASTEYGGSKANWITDTLSSLPTSFPNIKAFVWFNWNIQNGSGLMDWPIESSSSAQAAFANAIASPDFASNTFGSLPPLTTIQPLSSSTTPPPPPADTTAPTVSITAPTNNATVSGASTAISANASDNTAVAGVQFKLDGNNLGSEDTTSPYSMTWNTTSAANGAHTLTAVARDAAGNTKTSSAVNVTVNNTVADTTPPDTSITANPTSPTTSTSAAFSFTSSESSSTFECKLDSGNYGTCTSPKTYSGLAIGSHTFSVRATDAAGNTDATPATYTWNVAAAPDTTAPTVGFTSPANNATVSGIVTATANASDNVGVSKVDFSLDGSTKLTDTASPYNYSFDSKTLSNGNHTLTAQAYDAAGNTSTATITVKVNNPDITPPNTPTGLNATATNPTTVSLTWNASTDTGPNPTGVAKYNVLRNGVVVAQPTTASYTDTTATANTAYSYTVQAVDGAGNVSNNSGTATVTTPKAPDTTPPTTPTAVQAAAVNANQVNLSWNASTDTGGSGLAGYNIYRNGTKLNSTPITGTSYGDSTVNASTIYNYTIEAVDGAGNKSAQTSAVSVTTPNAPDTIAPDTPSNLTAKAVSSSQVALTWSAATDTGGSGLAGYNVYRDGTKLNDSLMSDTAYNDTSVNASTTYSYTVQAVDGAGNTSAQSSAVKVSTPNATGTKHSGGGGSSLHHIPSTQPGGGSTSPTSTTPPDNNHRWSDVSIKIYGSGNQPVHGAAVTVSNQTATTDSSGTARFSNVPAGNQTVAVSYNGKTTSKAVDVKAAAATASPEFFNVSLERNLNPVLLAVPIVALLAIGGFFMRPWEKFAKSPVGDDTVDRIVTSNEPTEAPTQPGRKLETPGTVYSPKQPKDDKSSHDDNN